MLNSTENVFNSHLKSDQELSCAQIKVILTEPSRSHGIVRKHDGPGFVEIFQFYQRSTTVSRLELQVFDQITHEPVPVNVYHGDVTLSAIIKPCNDAQTASGVIMSLDLLLFLIILFL